jgi:hypothetical protein
VINTTERPREYTLQAQGLPGLRVESATRFTVPAATTDAVPMRLAVPEGSAPPGSSKIEITVTAVDDPSISVREKTAFLGLRR